MPPVRSIGHPSSLRRSRRTAAAPSRDRGRTPPGRRGYWARALQRPAAHHARMPDSNSSLTGSPSQSYSPRTWSDRRRPAWPESRCRRSVYRPRRRGTADARSHAQRPMLDVELAEIVAVEVVGEAADDVGVEIGHREDDVGGVAMGHHESGVGKDLVQGVEPQHMRRRLQPPWPCRLAPAAAASSPAAGRRRSSVRSAVSTSHAEYDGICAKAWKIWDLKSSAISSRHSIGAWVPVGTWAREPTGVAARRPGSADRDLSRSTAAGTVATTPSGAGNESAGSCASSTDRAVEPVRGRPSPISGATISTSSISGWRRYQSSTCSRCDRCGDDAGVEVAPRRGR